MSEAVTEPCDPSVVQDLRRAAKSNFCEVKQLKQSVEYLIADFENHRSLSRKTNKTIEGFTERIVDLEASFKQVGNDSRVRKYFQEFTSVDEKFLFLMMKSYLYAVLLIRNRFFSIGKSFDGSLVMKTVINKKN